MSYYVGFNLEKDQFVLFNDISNDLYIGDKKIKSLHIKYDFNKFKNENSYFQINEKIFNELSKLNQYYIVDLIRKRDEKFVSQYNLEEWII
jgi:hypothetical protein